MYLSISKGISWDAYRNQDEKKNKHEKIIFKKTRYCCNVTLIMKYLSTFRYAV